MTDGFMVGFHDEMTKLLIPCGQIPGLIHIPASVNIILFASRVKNAIKINKSFVYFV